MEVLYTHIHTHTHTQSREIPNVVMGIYYYIYTPLGLPGGSDGKESTCSAGDLGLIPGLGRSDGEGNGYPFQDSSNIPPEFYPVFPVYLASDYKDMVYGVGGKLEGYP